MHPTFFWISTDLDFGPSVTRTASASCVAPRSIFSRAADRNRTFLWDMAGPLAFNVGAPDRLALAFSALLLTTEPASSALTLVNVGSGFAVRNARSVVSPARCGTRARKTPKMPGYKKGDSKSTPLTSSTQVRHWLAR